MCGDQAGSAFDELEKEIKSAVKLGVEAGQPSKGKISAAKRRRPGTSAKRKRVDDEGSEHDDEGEDGDD